MLIIKDNVIKLNEGVLFSTNKRTQLKEEEYCTIKSKKLEKIDINKYNIERNGDVVEFKTQRSKIKIPVYSSEIPEISDEGWEEISKVSIPLFTEQLRGMERSLAPKGSQLATVGEIKIKEEEIFFTSTNQKIFFTSSIKTPKNTLHRFCIPKEIIKNLKQNINGSYLILRKGNQIRLSFGQSYLQFNTIEFQYPNLMEKLEKKFSPKFSLDIKTKDLMNAIKVASSILKKSLSVNLKINNGLLEIFSPSITEGDVLYSEEIDSDGEIECKVPFKEMLSMLSTMDKNVRLSFMDKHSPIKMESGRSTVFIVVLK
jgi:hypothetical protein